MEYGYARVSTDDQNPALQLEALKRAGCGPIFKDEGISGATTKRTSRLRCPKTLQYGDTLIVWKLDRLGRRLRYLIAMLDELRSRGVKFHSLTEHIDTDTPTGRAMWQMIGVLAEPERSMITERTRAGVKAAQAMPEGGKLRLRVSESLRRKGQRPEVCVSITDTGTGLGLWISNGIIQKYGGTIRFKSICIAGQNFTCFKVSLPDADFRVSESLDRIDSEAVAGAPNGGGMQ